MTVFRGLTRGLGVRSEARRADVGLALVAFEASDFVSERLVVFAQRVIYLAKLGDLSTQRPQLGVERCVLRVLGTEVGHRSFRSRTLGSRHDFLRSYRPAASFRSTEIPRIMSPR